MKKIILTGGGTAGHVTPHLALLPALHNAGFKIQYIGSHQGIERTLITKTGLTYHAIASGKLRRYFDMRNFTDMFRVVKGLGDALKILRREKPDLIFSKGGFVAVPVIIAARMLRIPTVVHESDFTPGLANRIASPFAHKICVAFPETKKLVPEKKGVVTGIPIREALLKGDTQKGLTLCGFENNGLPILLVTGGSLGAKIINQTIREALPTLTTRYRIIHLCGKGNKSTTPHHHYVQFEYVEDGLADLYAAADIVVSRAGAGTLFELLAMKKPHLLVPLSKNASRGDQILNAQSFKQQGFSVVLPEEEMTPARLIDEINALYQQRASFTNAMNKANTVNSTTAVMEVLLNAINLSL